MKSYTVLGVYGVDNNLRFAHHIEAENPHDAEMQILAKFHPTELIVAGVVAGHVSALDAGGTGPGSMTALRKKPKPPGLRKFMVDFIVTYYGSIITEAPNEEDAEVRFYDIPIGTLVEKTNHVIAQVEKVKPHQEGAA